MSDEQIGAVSKTVQATWRDVGFHRATVSARGTLVLGDDLWDQTWYHPVQLLLVSEEDARRLQREICGIAYCTCRSGLLTYQAERYITQPGVLVAADGAEIA